MLHPVCTRSKKLDMFSITGTAPPSGQFCLMDIKWKRERRKILKFRSRHVFKRDKGVSCMTLFSCAYGWDLYRQGTSTFMTRAQGYRK